MNSDAIWRSDASSEEKTDRFCLINAIQIISDVENIDITTVIRRKRLDDLSNKVLRDVLYRVFDVTPYKGFAMTEIPRDLGMQLAELSGRIAVKHMIFISYEL